MKTKTIINMLLLLLATASYAQKKPPAQKELQEMMKETRQMMDDAMKDLSPDEKKMMNDAMKQVEQMAKDGKMPGDKANVKIPEKQIAILTKIPKLSTASQYSSYLESLRLKALKKIDAAIVGQVETRIRKANSQAQLLNNLAPEYFLKKSPTSAVYAAIRVAQLVPATMPQNNLGVILHLTGYPQYALPVLEYLNINNKSANLLNNIGQCYMSLGDRAKASQFFSACLKVSPGHAEASCGTALIKIDAGKQQEAQSYIQDALKNGYSETLAKLAEQKKIGLDYDALKCKVPEYFNPEKCKPVPAATRLEEVKPVLAQRRQMKDLSDTWEAKKDEVDVEQGNKAEMETLMQAGARIHGFFPGAPFGKKALFMVMQNGRRRAERTYPRATEDFNDNQAANKLHEELEKTIGQRIAAAQPDNSYESCKIQADESNKYLQKSAEFYDSKVRKSVFEYYDFANQQLYWYRFLVNDDQYKVIFYHTATDLMKSLLNYDKFQRLGRPDYVVTHCEKILKEGPRKELVTALPDVDCPVKIKIPLGAGSFKMDCKGWELEGGEGAVLGIQKDYKTGEFTMAFGVGANLEIPEIGVGAKGQAFFKFDRDFSPIDCGMILEAGGEAAAGPVMIAEEKINAAIGMTSGINVSGVHGGKQSAIFEYDPSK